MWAKKVIEIKAMQRKFIFFLKVCLRSIHIFLLVGTNDELKMLIKNYNVWTTL